MACTAQHRMQGITERTLERISGQLALRFHVPMVGSMALRPLDHRLHGPGHPPALA